ncbi:uncharacterized protein (TIGR04255 family) [Variovorax boronicumulans]|uniref:TIGR04255 family protein n=1 Tax=Variovorax boronicumulans TaxID=436515 RepID=UPI00277EB996|nr:TIGR04255 family protein [Variovorax boronicumulans]MDP9990422.1 uncharacterized protein (TIGR04255 family) [Variovorax boronicumulans]MDQ0001067.1 uncharacterized protein (TIGR04255 family) [Variovorax boronicumulans]
MSLDALFPFGGDHAIQNATFILEWKEPLDEHRIKDIKTRVQQRLQAFTGIKPLQNLVLNFAPAVGGNVPAAQSMTQTGFVFEIPGASPTLPPRRLIAALKESLQVTVNDYGRWNNVHSDVEGYLKAILPAIGSQRVASVGLQYTDVFTWRADPQTLNFREVFREGCPYIASNIFELHSFWHSHHGFFRQIDDIEGRPSGLDNVNVNCANNATDTLTLTITTSHKINFASPEWQDSEKMISKVEPIFESFHKTNKKILHSLLSDEVCRKIKLST